jgi:hypothetical protein
LINKNYTCAYFFSPINDYTVYDIRMLFILPVINEACEGNEQQVHADVPRAMIDRFAAAAGLKAQHVSASG